MGTPPDPCLLSHSTPTCGRASIPHSAGEQRPFIHVHRHTPSDGNPSYVAGCITLFVNITHVSAPAHPGFITFSPNRTHMKSSSAAHTNTASTLALGSYSQCHHRQALNSKHSIRQSTTVLLVSLLPYRLLKACGSRLTEKLLEGAPTEDTLVLIERQTGKYTFGS